jgi:hypothetical protein
VTAPSHNVRLASIVTVEATRDQTEKASPKL